ncbi:MAG: hypothetical protein RJA36_2612 [Pseudomonadota bacterium]|jgi:hypothetical protein
MSINQRRSHLSLSTLAALSLLSATAAQAADWSDTYLGYRYGTEFREPTNANHISKDIVQFTHASGYKLGSNFLNVDTLMSDSKDPANGANSKGAQEIYITYRNQLSMGKAFDLPTKVGPLSDVALTAGFDFNSKNTAFAPNKRALVFGPTLKFDVPGFLDVGLWYYREQNHKGVGSPPNPNVTFDGALMLSTSWGIPFQAGGAPMKFQGFLNYIGSKGLDYNNKSTAPETLMRTSVMLDVGQVVYGRKNSVWAGIGYEYWNNKFGNQPGVGTRVSAPQLQLEVHF